MDINKRANNQFCEIDFFEEEKLERYWEYSKLHSDFDVEEIVWRVNNNLDKEKYCFDVEIKSPDSPYVVVNKYFKLPAAYCPTDLVSVDGVVMRKDTADAYLLMKNAAKTEGFSISATSAYRSIDCQKELYNRFLVDSDVKTVDKKCARPCYSEHHTGMAVDIQGSIPGGDNLEKTPEAAWLKENCFKFGFILRYLPETVEITGYSSEPWHYRYVGKQVSQDMHERNIKSFEEYYERFLKNKE